MEENTWVCSEDIFILPPHPPGKAEIFLYFINPCSCDTKPWFMTITFLSFILNKSRDVGFISIQQWVVIYCLTCSGLEG